MKQEKLEDRMQMRRLTTDDTAQYNALLRYAFQVTDSELASLGWNQKEMERSKKPVLKKTESFGWFDGEKLASQISVYPMQVNLFGRMYKMGGVTGVATYPEYMGRGLMSRLMKQALDNMRRNHQSVSMLFPYLIPYYRKKGWEIVSDKMTYTMPEGDYAESGQTYEMSVLNWYCCLNGIAERRDQEYTFNWGSGWENVFFNVTCENQRRADERIPILHSLPFKHKGVMTAPLIEPIEIEKYLAQGQIEQVICGGENYDGARPCNFDWVRALSRQCRAHDVTFSFIETGTNFIKDGRRYFIPNKRVQSEMAFKSGVSFRGRPMRFYLEDEYGEIPPERLYAPHFGPQCKNCGSRLTCNGCANCARCMILDPKG